MILLTPEARSDVHRLRNFLNVAGEVNMSRYAVALCGLALTSLALATPLGAVGAATIREAAERETQAIEAKMIAWRRDIHAHPELGNREFRTSALVAAHLRALGYDVREKVAHTGVVAVLKGGKPGPVIALRADMDALPVAEEVDLPFASKVRATWRGQETGVMHACGHDGHTAILMAAAEVFAKLRDELPGTVKLIFQPAEEGLPPGEEGGARLMIKEGALDNPRPAAIFGLHLTVPGAPGTIMYRAGATMAGSDTFRITVKGRQTHGARPWAGVDPIVLAAQIILGLQTIESRQVDVTSDPSVLTVGIINAGNRANIIPDKAEMEGTLRTFDLEMRDFIKRRVKETAEAIARSGGGDATTEWISDGYIPLINDVALTRRMLPTLQRVAGADKVAEIKPRTPAEDFSFYAQEVPALFFFVGVSPGDASPTLLAINHSPRFRMDEAGLLTGLRAIVHVALDYLGGPE
jgi:amidohydrolase